MMEQADTKKFPAVNVRFDADARVWVATSDDIAGLAIEAETVDALKGKVIAAILDLIEANSDQQVFVAIFVHLHPSFPNLGR